MGKRTRRAFNRAANWLEDASERAVMWLRAKGERRFRSKPLAFETDAQRMMRLISDQMIKSMLPGLLEEIRRFPPALTYSEQPIGREIKIRMPADVD